MHPVRRLPMPHLPMAVRLSGVALLLGVVACIGLPEAAAQGDSSCPLNFTATPQAAGAVTFHWSGFGGADGYQVFGNLGLGNTAAYSPMLSGDARDSTRSSLAPGNYDFWVVAFHSNTVAASSCHRQVTVAEGGLAAACPADLTATPGAGFISLSWQSVAGGTGYAVSRSTDGSPFVHDFAAIPDASTTTFVDHNVTAGTTYRYIVSTHNTRLPPEACQPVSATLLAVPFFPTPAAAVLATLGAAAGCALLLRRRK